MPAFTIVLQIVLYLGVFTGMVALSVRGGAIDGLFFYPEPVQERAFAIGLADQKITEKKKKRFLISLCIVMLVLLLLVIGLWNKANNFRTAYMQALLFLEVMNWYDGFVIDKLWVGHSKFWVLPGTEDLPFVPTWKQMFTKRAILTLVWAIISAVISALVLLIF